MRHNALLLLRPSVPENAIDSVPSLELALVGAPMRQTTRLVIRIFVACLLLERFPSGATAATVACHSREDRRFGEVQGSFPSGG